MTYSEIVSFLWSVADLIRDTFKRGKYQDVILPFTVLRRIDGVLAPTKARVLERHAALKGKLEDLDAQLRRASGFAFYNTSRYDFDRLHTRRRRQPRRQPAQRHQRLLRALFTPKGLNPTAQGKRSVALGKSGP